MRRIASRDGTTIAFDQSGRGPALILVAGALQYRAYDQGMAQLADLLAQHFTVFHYDRRGRGDSTDTQPYTLEREIEDIEALIDEAGGSAFLYGISSGAALAMEAALKLDGKVKKLAMYEMPYNDDPDGRKAWREYTNGPSSSYLAAFLGCEKPHGVSITAIDRSPKMTAVAHK